MKRRTFLGLGASSIGVGAMFGTGAFSSVSAGRGVSVSAVSDSNALLGIEGTDSAETLSLTNNFSSGISVKLDAVETGIAYEIDGVVEDDPATINLASGGNKDVFFDSSDGNESVTIDFTATSNNGQATVTLQRTVQIPQSELLELTPNVTSAGSSGKFEFEVTNTGEIDVTIDAVAIKDATTVKSDTDPVEIDTELTDITGNNNYAPGPINVLNRKPTTGDFISFVNPIQLNAGDVNVFETDVLVEKNNNSGKLKGANYSQGGTLDASLKLGDGSTALLEMVV
jgi:hypothetical protein